MPATRQKRHRLGPWIVAEGTNIFYRPEDLLDRPTTASASQLRFPTPQIRARRTRPHAIHIVTYPSGYVPRELRPGRPQRGHRDTAASKASKKNKPPKSVTRSSTKSAAKPERPASTKRRYAIFAALLDAGNRASRRDSDASCSTPPPSRPVLGKLLASFSGSSLASTASASTAASTSTVEPPPPAAAPATGVSTPPAYDDVGLSAPPQQYLHALHSQHAGTAAAHQQQAHHCQHLDSPPLAARDLDFASTNVDAASPAAMTASGLDLTGNSYTLPPNHRNSLISVRSAKSAVSSLVTETPKPVASGSGVSCSIILAEPNIFLTGFDHDGNHREDQSGTALLRGKLQLKISKNVKIKAVQLKLLGRARTEWPEGIPPLKQELFEEESLRTQVLTFFNAMHDGWESDYGNQCTYNLKNSSANSSSTNLAIRPAGNLLVPPSQRNMTAKELKRLSLHSVQSRSFNKNDCPVATATQAKGFKVFYPGTYDYTFELPIDHHQLETTKLQYGSVKWELHATVDRAGAFKPNLHGMKEVSIVRLPDQLSLEMSEPISISRMWEDQLHYDIIISGKSFPIGAKIPIAFKLTPLAKVQVHKLKVYVTESIEYWTNDKRVTRKDPGRKILLLEKSAGKPLDPAWASSEVRTLRGGELAPEERRHARATATQRRQADAARHHTSVEPLPEPCDNILGDLDLGLESMWGSTEMEANVQIPTCEMMAKNKDLRLHPDCSWKNVNVYHWIKVVMRISRLDPEDPTGKKRRHFEISIDSPFTVLNCRATQANTNLPAYSGPVCHPSPYQATCGCPDSASIPTDTSPSSSTGTLAGPDPSVQGLPAPPQAAHLSTAAIHHVGGPESLHRVSVDSSPRHAESRPIHLLRAPSFNPPPFDDDVAPPPTSVVSSVNPYAVNAPAETPPPQYDVIVGTPSVDGMADYFSRLADYGYDEPDDSASDSDETPPRILERTGRVNVAHPRTPGGRMQSRSMEISRPPITLQMDNIRTEADANRAAETAV